MINASILLQAAAATGNRTETKTNHISNADDALFQRELLKTFEQTSPVALMEMRKLLQETTKADEVLRAAHVEQLYRKVRSFAASAGPGTNLYTVAVSSL